MTKLLLAEDDDMIGPYRDAEDRIKFSRPDRAEEKVLQIKVDGNTWNAVDVDRVRRFMDKVEALR